MAKVEAKKEIISIAVYKANLHCPKCAHDIKKPLMRTPGVHKVDVQHEKNEITVEGTFEVKKIHERLEKWSRKKVEILSQDKKPLEKKETKKASTSGSKAAPLHLRYLRLQGGACWLDNVVGKSGEFGFGNGLWIVVGAFVAF
ncbi:heavy metal-associated isoprenylated plant protein 4 [Tanacetum coccineum]